MKFIYQKGFSLVELSIVLVVVGLLLGSTIAGLSDFIWHARNAQAKKDLTLIEEALFGYAISKGGLPCPDTTGFPNNPENADGVADGAGACGAVRGFLPWTDLGLKANDPWGTPYLYRLDTIYAKPPSDTTTDVTFILTAADGNIEILNSAGGLIVADNIAAVFFSVGPNGYLTVADAPSPDEQENLDATLEFVDKAYVAPTAGSNEYDDVMQWLSSFALKSRMVQAQRLP
jgi:prepilin-type N-terminal cleavage/methylation domain-containing protein